MSAILAMEGDSTEARLVRVLNSIRPKRMSATGLMKAVGIEFSESLNFPGVILPQTALVEFLNAVIRARRLVECSGYWLMQESSSAFDEYWIEPQGLSS